MAAILGSAKIETVTATCGHPQDVEVPPERLRPVLKGLSPRELTARATGEEPPDLSTPEARDAARTMRKTPIPTVPEAVVSAQGDWSHYGTHRTKPEAVEAARRLVDQGVRAADEVGVVRTYSYTVHRVVWGVVARKGGR